MRDRSSNSLAKTSEGAEEAEEAEEDLQKAQVPVTPKTWEAILIGIFLDHTVTSCHLTYWIIH